MSRFASFLLLLPFLASAEVAAARGADAPWFARGSYRLGRTYLIGRDSTPESSTALAAALGYSIIGRGGLLEFGTEIISRSMQMRIDEGRRGSATMSVVGVELFAGNGFELSKDVFILWSGGIGTGSGTYEFEPKDPDAENGDFDDSLKVSPVLAHVAASVLLPMTDSISTDGSLRVSFVGFDAGQQFDTLTPELVFGARFYF